MDLDLSDRLLDLDDLSDAARERLRDRRSPCLSLTDREESLDDLTLVVHMRSFLGGAVKQHLTSRMRVRIKDALPNIHGRGKISLPDPELDPEVDPELDLLRSPPYHVLYTPSL